MRFPSPVASGVGPFMIRVKSSSVIAEGIPSARKWWYVRSPSCAALETEVGSGVLVDLDEVAFLALIFEDDAVVLGFEMWPLRCVSRRLEDAIGSPVRLNLLVRSLMMAKEMPI
jgi:hypothetical protein